MAAEVAVICHLLYRNGLYFLEMIIVESVVVHGIWVHHVPPLFSSEAISLLCWMNVGVSSGVHHCLSVVFTTFSAILLLRKTHSIKVSQIVGKSCKTFSASSRRMQQHWGFPPNIYLKIPNTSPTDQNSLGDAPHPEQTVCMIKVQGSRWDQAEPLQLDCALVVVLVGRCVGNTAMNSMLEC